MREGQAAVEGLSLGDRQELVAVRDGVGRLTGPAPLDALRLARGTGGVEQLGGRAGVVVEGRGGCARCRLEGRLEVLDRQPGMRPEPGTRRDRRVAAGGTGGVATSTRRRRGSDAVTAESAPARPASQTTVVTSASARTAASGAPRSSAFTGSETRPAFAHPHQVASSAKPFPASAPTTSPGRWPRSRSRLATRFAASSTAA